MIAQAMPPPPDEAAAKPVDRLRRHYDRVDAEAIVRRFKRDYDMNLRQEPCPLRRGLHHIELAIDLTEEHRALLVRYADGYLPHEMAHYFPTSTASRLGDKLSYIAKETGLISRHQLITVCTFFGIITPTIMAERGEYV